MSPIDLKMWWPRYQKILDQFQYSITKDQEAANLLSEYIKQVALTLEYLKEKVQGKKVIVCGAGPSISTNLEHIVTNIAFENTVIFAADGATTACLEYGLVPDYIMTDLDGKIEDILSAQKQSAVVIVHAHGDNINALETWVPRLNQRRSIGSTQTRPQPGVYNLGGFTDGDRCVFWAEGLHAAKIALAGMDLGNIIGQYSKPELITDVVASPEKRQKLEVAKELLSWLATWSESELFNVTGVQVRIPGIPNRRIEHFSWE
ncbi:MAG: 6-hydroxymethylpterin diphosphokinase MptE-like protein [Candidatus Hodarchaeota archaeon]